VAKPFSDKTFSAPWFPLLAATVIGGAVVSLLSNTFATEYNFFVILQEASTYAVIGFAAMVVLAVRDISLAVSGIGSLSAVLFGWMVADLALPLAVSALATILLGVLAGWINGVVIARSGLSGFVVTLATGAALTGIALGVTKATAFSDIPREWSSFGQGRLGPFPLIGIVTLVLAVALFVLYRWGSAGRSMLAVGGNPSAARLAGISGTRQLVLAHMLSGALASIAALIYVGRLSSAPPDLGGSWILISFAVPIIGGTALNGGRLSVPGAVIAAIVLATINDALIILKVSQYGVIFAQGLLILLAVFAGRIGGFGLLRRRNSHTTELTPPTTTPGEVTA